MLVPEKLRTTTRLAVLLILLAALFFVSHSPVAVKANVCCGECDSRKTLCYAHCPGSGSYGCANDCQTQFDICEQDCTPDPCY